MNTWWWVLIGVALWLVVGAAVGLVVGWGLWQRSDALQAPGQQLAGEHAPERRRERERVRDR